VVGFVNILVPVSVPVSVPMYDLFCLVCGRFANTSVPVSVPGIGTGTDA
jgi:hypothetical protein